MQCLCRLKLTGTRERMWHSGWSMLTAGGEGAGGAAQRAAPRRHGQAGAAASQCAGRLLRQPARAGTAAHASFHCSAEVIHMACTDSGAVPSDQQGNTGTGSGGPCICSPVLSAALTAMCMCPLVDCTGFARCAVTVLTTWRKPLSHRWTSMAPCCRQTAAAAAAAMAEAMATSSAWTLTQHLRRRPRGPLLMRTALSWCSGGAAEHSGRDVFFCRSCLFFWSSHAVECYPFSCLFFGVQSGVRVKRGLQSSSCACCLPWLPTGLCVAAAACLFAMMSVAEMQGYCASRSLLRIWWSRGVNEERLEAACHSDALQGAEGFYVPHSPSAKLHMRSMPTCAYIGGLHSLLALDHKHCRRQQLRLRCSQNGRKNGLCASVPCPDI